MPGWTPPHAPILLTNARTDSTPSATAHAQDHDQAANAINDILALLGTVVDSNSLVVASALPTSAATQIRATSGAPSVLPTDQNGDFAIDATTDPVFPIVYGPMAGGVWPAGSQLGPSARSLDPLAPTGAVAESYPRSMGGASGSVAAPTVSALMYVNAVWLRAGKVVNSIKYFSGGTGATTPTHQWAVMADASRSKLAVTNDDTSNAWSANTAKSFTFTGPVTVASTGLYYFGLVVVAATVNNLSGITISNLITGLAPITAGTSTGSLTDPTSCPTTLGALTATTFVPYFVLS